MEKIQHIPSSRIEATADGSHTLFVPELDEHYHSVNGAIQESTHVFIQNGLLQMADKKEIRVLEIGFGTGLNALLTLLHTEKAEQNIHYTSLELYPIGDEIASLLNYPSRLGESETALFFNALHAAPWGKEAVVTPRFTLLKRNVDFTICDFPDSYDLIYFDAFAPEKQPDMWEQALFDRIAAATNEGGILATYCAKGEVRRRLQHSGFKVNRLPGPPGKRQMMQGVKIIESGILTKRDTSNS